MLLGAHLSISGGLHKALERAASHEFDTVALFVRNQVQWRLGELTDEQTAAFRRTRRQVGISPVVAHASYLVNLAGQKEIREKSITAMIEDLTRCGRLGIEYLVLHPGSNEDARAGVELIADGLNRIVSGCERIRPKILLETTAGQGNTIGRSFEQLAEILSQTDRPRRFGVCLDTCHVYAAGYDIANRRSYLKTMHRFDELIGLDRLLVVHLNDSKRELGSRVDRHEHIGRGRIGAAGIANFVRDRRLRKAPMILETPKGLDEHGRDWDRINAETVRELTARR